jgi:pimeloyl-ACP methyl ester carboxylesterase
MVKPAAALESFGMQEVVLGPDLRLNEIHTMRGLLSLMWHGPQDAEQLVVCCPGAMGGLLGPGRGMFHKLGQELAQQGIATVAVDYRRPNDLQACVLDAVAALDLGAQRGVTKAVAIGHSFGGAIAVNVGAIISSAVAGVCTLSTQSAGCEIAGKLAPRPFLLIHGDRDDILPPFASEAVRELAGGHGELVIAEGEGHALVDNSGDVYRRVLSWTTEVLSAT